MVDTQKPEIKIDLKWDGEKVHIDAQHPGLDEARTAYVKAHGEAMTAVGKADKEALDAYLGKISEAGEDAAKKAAVETEARALMKKHASKELGAVEAAEGHVKKLETELHTAKLDALKAAKADPTKIAGHTKEAEEKIGKALEGHISETENTLKTLEKTAEKGKWFSRMRSEGIGSALSHNIGGKAFKESKIKFAGNWIFTGLGGIMVYDGLLHGKRKDEQGNRTEGRSLLIRSGEVVGGAALMAASALRGGHAR